LPGCGARPLGPGLLGAGVLKLRFRGNPFLRAVARQKFLPPGSLALSRFSQRATVGACKNRSAAPAAPSLLRPLDALGAAAPWGQNLPLNRALGLTASHTLSGKFPCMCPVQPHMSAGRDFFDNLPIFCPPAPAPAGGGDQPSSASGSAFPRSFRFRRNNSLPAGPVIRASPSRMPKAPPRAKSARFIVQPSAARPQTSSAP